MKHTRGEDIYATIKEMLRKRGIDLKRVVSVTTDGAPAMEGKERGGLCSGWKRTAQILLLATKSIFSKWTSLNFT